MYQVKLYDNSPTTFIFSGFVADIKDKMTTAITKTGAGVITNPHFLLESMANLLTLYSWDLC